jgi:predicted ATP-grasp superfamily ATP-dependent carboligase
MTTSDAAEPHAGAPLGGTSVLIGFADALAATETAFSLLDAGANVAAFVRRGARPALRRCPRVELHEIPPPEDGVDAAITGLSSVIERCRCEAVLPLDDTAVWLCDRAIGTASGPALVGPRGAQAEFALDKHAQLAAASLAGLRVPPTLQCTGPADARPDAIGFPLVIKPRFAVQEVDGRLVRQTGSVCADARELALAQRRMAPDAAVMVQPFIRGVGEGIFGLGDEGGARLLSSHRRIRMMNPGGSGSSACRSHRVDPTLVEPLGRMLRDARWSGLFMLELLRSADGTAWFMEVNGRPWGSMALARRMGYEYPAWAVARTFEPGFMPPAPGDRADVTCRHLGRELLHTLFVLRGPPSRAFTDWPSVTGTLLAVFSVHRDDCWYNLRRGAYEVFIADTVGTVWSGVARGRSSHRNR